MNPTAGLISLALLLSIMNAPPVDGAETSYVAFEDGGYDMIRGRACGPSLIFPGDTPNPDCRGYGDRHQILYPDQIAKYGPGEHGTPKWMTDDEAMRWWIAKTAIHEKCHADIGLDLNATTAWGQNQEARCYAVEYLYGWEFSYQMWQERQSMKGAK